MKKRLRKKLRLREFQEMGFHVNFSLPSRQSEAEVDTFINDIIAFAESNGLFLAGGVNFFFVTAGARHSVSEKQRQLFKEWLMEKPIITDLQVLPLSNAWYVKEEEWNDALPHELLGRLGLND